MMDKITQHKTLEDRVRDKLHESLGDLIQPEDIKVIVERGISDFLFQPRVVERRGGYGGADIKASLVQELIEKHLASKIQTQVHDWIKDNPERLESAMQAAITRGIGNAVITTFDEKFNALFEDAIMNLQGQGLLPHA